AGECRSSQSGLPSSQVLSVFDLFGLRRAKEVSTPHFIPYSLSHHNTWGEGIEEADGGLNGEDGDRKIDSKKERMTLSNGDKESIYNWSKFGGS
ncbi:hypothetical protein JOQ06_009232, partial [Pogonophryne albipinna]